MDKPSSFQSFEQAMQSLSQRISSRGLMRESVILRLFQHVALRLNDYMDAPFKEHGLNATLWTSLVVIYASPDRCLKPSELSVFLNSSRTNSTRVARELQRHGFLRRAADSNDRRQVLLKMTPKGAKFVETLLPSRGAYVKQALQEFETQEVDELERLLRKLLDRLD